MKTAGALEPTPAVVVVDDVDVGVDVAVVIVGSFGPWKNFGGCIGGMAIGPGRKALGWSQTDLPDLQVTESRS